MVGMPKIPDAKEIAAMTKEAMDPMARDISAIKTDMAAIRTALEELVSLQAQTILTLGGEPVSSAHTKETCNGHRPTKTSAA